jgi:hypothetical protein
MINQLWTMCYPINKNWLMSPYYFTGYNYWNSTIHSLGYYFGDIWISLN